MVVTCNNLIKTTTTAVSSLIQIYLHHLLKPMGNKTEQLPSDLTAQCAYAWQVRKGELLVKNLNWSPLKSLENCFSQQNIFGVTIHCMEQEFPSKSHLLVHHTNNFLTWHASRYLLKTQFNFYFKDPRDHIITPNVQKALLIHSLILNTREKTTHIRPYTEEGKLLGPLTRMCEAKAEI